MKSCKLCKSSLEFQMAFATAFFPCVVGELLLWEKFCAQQTWLSLGVLIVNLNQLYSIICKRQNVDKTYEP